jgi:hypothetical protein
MRPLRYSINVTLDGCCDHRAMFADEDLHRHAADGIPILLCFIKGCRSGAGSWSVLCLRTDGIAWSNLPSPSRGADRPLKRRYGEGPQKGETFSAGTFTTLNAILTFVSGANVSFLASWDVSRHGVRPIELQEHLASIRVPDPDTSGGDVELSANNKLLNIHDASSVALAGTQVDWRSLPRSY